MSERKLHRARVAVRPRFRCLVCRTFVEGTEHGTCPRCGWEPPTVAPGEQRPHRASSMAAWLTVLLIVLAVSLGWLGPGR